MYHVLIKVVHYIAVYYFIPKNTNMCTLHMEYINIRKAIHCSIQNFADFTCSTNLADNILES